MVVDLMVKPDFDSSMKCTFQMPFIATERRLYGHEMAGKASLFKSFHDHTAKMSQKSTTSA